MTSSVVLALDAEAHDLRNAANVVLMASQLLGDHDVRPLEPHELVAVGGDIRTAGLLLMSRLDRIIEAARCELGGEVVWDVIELGALVDLAVRRARREGCNGVPVPAPDADEPLVRVVAGTAERVIADVIILLSGTDSHVSLEVSEPRDGRVAVRVRRDVETSPEIDALTTVLAAATDVVLHASATGVALSIPLAVQHADS